MPQFQFRSYEIFFADSECSGWAFVAYNETTSILFSDFESSTRQFAQEAERRGVLRAVEQRITPAAFCFLVGLQIFCSRLLW